MKKVSIQNLGMIVTNKCNLDCAHCMRGCKNSKDMTKEVIDASLNQIIDIGNLCICGGEPTMALDTIENIFNYIIDNRILLDNVSITINGTIYSPEFLKLLDYINEYIFKITNNNGVIFDISYDDYHKQELVRLKLLQKYIENVRRYTKSEYFYELRKLNPHLKLFREGNAEYLDESLTVNLRPDEIFVTYVDNRAKFDRENGLCNIGPLITVNPDGIITECDSSILHQETIYNYGNVFDNSIEEVALKRGLVLTPRKWNKACKKEVKKVTSYNK